MKLGEKQRLFMKLLPRLIDKIYESGYECSGGDLWSKPEYHAHKENSNHYSRLAIDINLFKDGVYLTDSMDHKPFGEFWESLNSLCCWGGRFQDVNHYSLENEGRR